MFYSQSTQVELLFCIVILMQTIFITGIQDL